MTKYTNLTWKETKKTYFVAASASACTGKAPPTASAVKERPDFITGDRSARLTPSERHFLAS
jgi:hypothetical protein